jgi:hypothetical protein
MNPFATHMPVLLAFLEHTNGPVLELGSGWFSTPIVSAFATDRLVRTIETNPEWYVRVAGLGIYQPITQHRHQFLFVPDYNDAMILDQQWDVVILDHEPPPRRGHDALVLRDRCRFMIGHDSEHPDYRYAEAFDQFRYRFTDSRRLPWTTVVSDEPLDWLADALRFPGGLA